MYVCGRESIQNIFVQNHRFGEKPTRSRMSLRPSGTIEPSAVDDRSFTGVASMGKLLQHESKIKINQPHSLCHVEEMTGGTHL